MTRATKPVQMACLTLGYRDYLMPADKAMKVAELMQSAFDCSKEFGDRDYYFVPTDQPRVEFVFVKPNQVRQPRTEPSPPRLLGGRS